MENFYQWLIIFSGATISLLGCLLYGSAREAKGKRLESDRLLENQRSDEEISKLRNQLEAAERRLEEAAAQSKEWSERQAEWAARGEQIEELTAEIGRLRAEADRLANKLETREREISELRVVQEHAKSEELELQRAVAKYREQFETSRSELEELRRVDEQAKARVEALQSEIRQWMQKFDESDAAIRTLESENHGLRRRNQDLEKELERRQDQLHASEARLQETIRQKQEAADLCARLEAEIADLKQRAGESRSRTREMEIAQQRIAELESKEKVYREQQQRLEALIADMERDLAASKEQRQALEDAHESLREAERVCQELRDENRRLVEETVQWQERLKTHEETQKQLKILKQRIEETQSARTQVTTENPISRGPSNGDASSAESRPVATPPRPADDHAARPVAVIDSVDGGRAAPPGRIFAHRKWRTSLAVGAVMVLLLAAAVVSGFFEANFLTPARLAGAPDTNAGEYTAETLVKVREKPAPRVRGTYEAIRSTGVYSERSENSALVAMIERGTKLNVVDSRDGWLEIRSKHGRPPGFVREEAAVKIRD